MGYSLTGTGECAGGIFSIPHALVDSGAFGELSSASCKLLTFLYAAMNARSAPCLRISGAQLVGALTMDYKTIRAARKELESKGLILCGRAAKAGAPCEFHLLNPENGEPFPPEDGRPDVADYKPRKSKAALAAPQNADSRAARAASGAGTIVAESQPPQHIQQPQGGKFTRSKQENEAEPACPIHQNKKVYFDGDGERHCGICDPSPYAPPEETFSRLANASPPLPFTPPTADEIFGRG
jgi:hypothetical protein